MKERIAVVIASVSATVLTVLAIIGWIVFIAGFSIFNKETEFFERIQILTSTQHLSPEAANTLRELLFIPYNSHYIIAAVSPVLFIFMVVKSYLLVFVSSEVAPKVSIIMSFFVSFEIHKPCEICVYLLVVGGEGTR
jgi:hypothetical protein